MRVLIVEDEKKIAAFIRKALQAEGFAVEVLFSGEEVVSTAATSNFDLIILDIMLPGMDGLSVMRALKQKKIATPILILTARGTVDEKVEGLNQGADDYLAKPFILAELIARVRALGRRGSQNQATVLSVSNLTLNTISRQAKRGDRSIELTAREYRLLEFLLRAPGRVCTRMAILENVWEYHFDPGTNLVDVYIMRLREKIDDEFETKLLHSIRGVGYVIKSPA